MAAGDRQSGFTLIELVVTMALAIILVTIAVPGFQDLMARSRLTADYNQVLSVMKYARSEAVKRKSPVTVDLSQASGTPWALEVREGGDVLRAYTADNTATTVGEATVVFNASGRLQSCESGGALLSPCEIAIGEKAIAIGLSGQVL